MTWRTKYVAWWWRTATRNVLAADRARRAAAGEFISVSDRLRAAAALERLSEAGAALEHKAELEAMLEQCEVAWQLLIERLKQADANEPRLMIVPPRWEQHRH